MMSVLILGLKFHFSHRYINKCAFLGTSDVEQLCKSSLRSYLYWIQPVSELFLVDVYPDDSLGSDDIGTSVSQATHFYTNNIFV